MGGGGSSVSGGTVPVTKAELMHLKREAIVALAGRCARRVLPLFQAAWLPEPPPLFDELCVLAPIQGAEEDWVGQNRKNNAESAVSRALRPIERIPPLSPWQVAAQNAAEAACSAGRS